MFQVEKSYKMYNGVSIPSIGYGTWKITDPQVGIRAMREAIEVGYRHLDSAQGYGNEETLGEAIRQSGIDRKELFITGKVLNSSKGYESTLQAFDQTLKNLGTDYLDLYLIHWPKTKDTLDTYRELNRQTWKAFEKLYDEGLVRAIGVSNFHKPYLEELLSDNINIKPMMDQIEIHPHYFERETIEFAKANDMLVSGYSPLMRGGQLEDPVFVKLAQKHGKTPAQVVLRWALQKGTIPLPKTVTRERMISNLDVYGFQLDQDDMAILDAQHRADGKIGSHPDHTKF